MSQTNDKFNPFDPTGMLKEMQDSNMTAWANMMTQLVHNKAYAEATGAMLDLWLTTSAPFRKTIETVMTKALTELNLPTRDSIDALAQRLTNIEMRLDDLEAAMSETKRRTPAKRKTQNGE
ncbi:MAG: hypothetical protein ACFCD0_16935 [Gemmataceae bacterium]